MVARRFGSPLERGQVVPSRRHPTFLFVVQALTVFKPFPRRALLASIGLAACLGAPLNAAVAASAVTITVASFPDLDRAVKAAVPRWETLHPDVKVKVVSLQYADHHTAMTTALATGSGLPDVMAVDLRFIGKFANGGGLDDLLKPPYNAGPLLNRLVRYSAPQATNSRGELTALPTDIGPGTLLYRKDLLDQAGITEAELTASWASLIEAGKKLKARTGAFLLPDAADLRDIVLRQGLKDGEGIYFDSTGKVLVDSPRFVRAFEIGLAARQAGIDAKVVAWTNEWAAGFKQDRIAADMMGAWLAGHLKNWIAPAQAGRWRATGLPGGVFASYGGSFYAVPRRAEHKAQAWAFIQFMVMDKQTQLESLRVLDAFPALLAAQAAPMMDEPIAYLGGQKARLLWRDIAAQVPALTVNRHDAMATDVIRDEFENVVAHGKDIRAALADAQALIERRSRRR
jgi:multiple sugar transport system substrate-binding protein